jgi:hypothetical protein
MAAAIVLAAATMAAAGDKLVSSMNQPVGLLGVSPPPLAGPLSPNWLIGGSVGKVKLLPSCKLSVKLTGTTLPDSDGIPSTGDEVLCLVDFNNLPFFGAPAGLILRGEVNNGAMKISADFPAQLLGFLCLPSSDFSEMRSTCYEPDGAYFPFLPLPFASDINQGVFGPGYPPRPASGLLATESVRY